MYIEVFIKHNLEGAATIFNKIDVGEIVFLETIVRRSNPWEQHYKM